MAVLLLVARLHNCHWQWYLLVICPKNVRDEIISFSRGYSTFSFLMVVFWYHRLLRDVQDIKHIKCRIHYDTLWYFRASFSKPGNSAFFVFAKKKTSVAQLAAGNSIFSTHSHIGWSWFPFNPLSCWCGLRWWLCVPETKSWKKECRAGRPRRKLKPFPAVPVQPAAWLAAFFLSNFRPAKAGQCEVEGENQKTCKGRHWKPKYA